MVYVKKTGFLIAVSLFSFGAATSYAQVEQATTIADPARIGQDLLDQDALPELSREAPASAKPRFVQNAPAGAEHIKLTLEKLMVEGVHIYSDADLSYIYEGFIGKEITLEDVYAISNEITNKYRSDGYILTQAVVPPQTIDDGQVTLRVVEGFIDQILIEGEPIPSAEKRIRDYAEKIRGENIVDAKILEHYLLLINDLPGVKARSVLSPSKTVVGASDLMIIIERDRYDAQASFSNNGSRFLGPYQGLYRGSYNSLFGFNEKISGTVAVSGDKERVDELLFGSLSYEQPISETGTLLRLTGSYTSTEPGADLDEFDVEGRSRFIQGTVIHPFIRSRTTNFTGRFGFDFRHVTSSNDLEATRKDRISSFRLGTTYQFIDTFLGVGVNALDLEISHGVGLFGASGRNDSNLTRAEGNSRYHKAELSLQRLQRVAPKLNLLLAGQAQLASSALLSSEEFGVGGASFGRGYDSSEIVGEDGFAGKIELQWRQPKDIQHINDYQLYTFYDAGRVFNKDATTSDGKRDSLASTGFGVRADITQDFQAGFGVAFPLTRRVDATNDRGPRYFFNLTHKF